MASFSTGVGGVCFAVYYDAGSQGTTTLNGNEHAPVALDVEDLQAQGSTPGFVSSPESVTVTSASHLEKPICQPATVNDERLPAHEVGLF
jgi:gamma-glutamyltranspeptidase